MRVSKDHLEKLSAAITPLDTDERRAAYRAGRFPRADRVNNLDKRYRWDLFWASDAISELSDGRYADAHIDTALRRIVPAL